MNADGRRFPVAITPLDSEGLTRGDTRWELIQCGFNLLSAFIGVYPQLTESLVRTPAGGA